MVWIDFTIKTWIMIISYDNIITIQVRLEWYGACYHLARNHPRKRALEGNWLEKDPTQAQELRKTQMFWDKLWKDMKNVHCAVFNTQNSLFESRNCKSSKNEWMVIIYIQKLTNSENRRYEWLKDLKWIRPLFLHVHYQPFDNKKKYFS